MIEVAIMIEGQNGLTWQRWQRVANLVEELGFAGLYRSDHYTNADPPDKESLELWVSLTWLASHTQRIEFGPLVSPVSFRHPTLTARMAAAVDDLSGGRLTLGMGAGWQEREHNNYGWDLMQPVPRFERFEEGLQVVTRLLHSDQPVDFEGQYYQLQEAILLPRPQRPGGPPILIGGNGYQLTLPLAAKYAGEWNGVYLTAPEFKQRSAKLDELLEENGRNPNEVKRSMMTGLEYGRDDKEVKQLVNKRTSGKLNPNELAQKGIITGTTGQVVDQLGVLNEAGVQRVMLQWLALDDTERLADFGSQVLPQIR